MQRAPSGLYHPYSWVLHGGADELRAQGRLDEAASLDRMADLQVSLWLTGNTTDEGSMHDAMVGGNRDKGVAGNGQIATVVLYNIPHRDCGSYSAGGLGSAADYRAWVDRVSTQIADNHVIVIVEPDALHVTDCLSADLQSERWSLLRYATETLKSRNPNAVTYIATLTNFNDDDVIVDRLRQSGIDNTRGFALNVSNFETTQTNITYGERLRKALGTDAKYVIDTSRNGSGPLPSPANSEAVWCNPPGRTVGEHPTLTTGVPNVDAYLWVKDQTTDGACTNSNPVQYPYEYSVDIAKRSGF